MFGARLDASTADRLLLTFAVLFALSLPAQVTAAADTTVASADDSDRAATTARSKRLSTRERAAARRAAREAAAQEKRNSQRQQWLARLAVRDVEPWPESESDEVHAAALARSQEMIDEVLTLWPGTERYETEHFLFISNMPPQQVAPHVVYLDRMYVWMCELYGVPRGHKVWLGGKAPIFAFVEQQQFEQFEERYFREARQSLAGLTNIYGLCHLSTEGDVVIACYRGNNPHDFGQMLVHETSHGFIHRYKTKAQLPNWVDEGMADLIGAEMVPTSTVVKDRELKAVQWLAQNRSLGGMLTAKRIEAHHYGMASSLNRFLLQANRAGYVAFIEALKEGMTWDEALRHAYGSSPEELLAHYSRWMGVPGLRP
jgi:hypothetical protein